MKKSPSKLSLRRTQFNTTTFQPPDFVKIDVEGAEHRVLDGFGGVLSDVRTLLIEVHYDDSTPQRLDEIRDRLTDTGFTVTELAHREPRIQQTHLLAERK